MTVADIDDHAAREAVAGIASAGDRAEPQHLDVADKAAWLEAAERSLAAHRRLDVVVNNAGISFGKQVADMSLAEWRRVQAVNLDGVFLGTKYGIRAMQSGNGGSIVNIASVSGSSPSRVRVPTGPARRRSACSRRSLPSSVPTRATACGSTSPAPAVWPSLRRGLADP